MADGEGPKLQEPPPRYRAFISYSHADKAVAALLHRSVESYRVPSKLVGKTTAVGVISDSPPLTTEAAMTDVAAEIDRTGDVPEKTTTTVAIDFGTIRLDESLKLYLFGTPGQDRFGFMWHDICLGALGALVIVDTRRLDDCFPAVDYFEQTGIPFVVAINMFHGRLKHKLDDVRWAVAAS